MRFETFEELVALEKKTEETSNWRHRPDNRYLRDGLALVSRVRPGADLKESIRRSVDLIGGFRRSLSPGDRVLVKPNFNSGDPLPAATDPAFLVAVIELLQEEGLTDLTIGDRSGWPSLPTQGVMERLGVLSAARDLGVKVIPFDDGPWMDLQLGPLATHWNGRVAFPLVLKDFDKLVYLPCLKTHRRAGFTASLKMNVGLTHPAEMPHLHADTHFGAGDPRRTDEPLYARMLEFCLPVGPDLIIMDARRAFVMGGPAQGEMVEPDLILASGDRLAIDVEGVKILQQYPRDNQIQQPVWNQPLIKRAIELGLGARSEDDYQVVEG